MFVPELQGQSWWENPVPDPSNLSRVSPDQLDHRHMSQVQSTLSVLFPQKHRLKLNSYGIKEKTKEHNSNNRGHTSAGLQSTIRHIQFHTQRYSYCLLLQLLVAAEVSPLKLRRSSTLKFSSNSDLMLPKACAADSPGNLKLLENVLFICLLCTTVNFSQFCKKKVFILFSPHYFSFILYTG